MRHTATMSLRTLMAAVFLVAGVLAIAGAALGWGDETLSGTAKAIWIVGAVTVWVAAGIGGYSLVVTAPTWLRAVVSAGAAALAAGVLTAFLPDLEADAGVVMMLGIVFVIVAAGLLVMARTAETVQHPDGQVTSGR